MLHNYITLYHIEIGEYCIILYTAYIILDRWGLFLNIQYPSKNNSKFFFIHNFAHIGLFKPFAVTHTFSGIRKYALFLYWNALLLTDWLTNICFQTIWFYLQYRCIYLMCLFGIPLDYTLWMYLCPPISLAWSTNMCNTSMALQKWKWNHECISSVL